MKTVAWVTTESNDQRHAVLDSAGTTVCGAPIGEPAPDTGPLCRPCAMAARAATMPR